jgi:N-acetylglucosamine kinase
MLSNTLVVTREKDQLTRGVLGIDGGGTTTVCVLMDRAGRVWERAETGASNYQIVGIEAAYGEIYRAIAEAIAPYPQLGLQSLCLGLAGVGRAEDVATVRSAIARLWDELPAKWQFSSDRALICSDREIALVGGLGHNIGIAAIAGTGSIVWGRNRHGETKRVGGWGRILGDEGSSYAIAVQGLQAVMRAFDGRSDPTRLTEFVLQQLGLHGPEELVAQVYRSGWTVGDLAKLAPLVDRAAREGDGAANWILDRAASEFVLATRVVWDSLFEKGDRANVVTVGGAWQGLPGLRQRYCREMASLATVVEPRGEPAYGAGLMALARWQC